MALDLADPTFEPTDEQLQRLSRDAFAEVAAKNREAMTRLRAQIVEWRATVLARLATSGRPR